jgi:methylenetetrahydrofolate--tRNA-(uracil-5-)-methyltransferase
LENAEFLRFGQIHRNSYVNAPELLQPTLQTRKNPGILFAGQICGVEGYVESIATGLVAGINASRLAEGRRPLSPPCSTACGSLANYLAFADPRGFQPVNISFGLLAGASAGVANRTKDRKERRRIQAEEALKQMDQWIESLAS